MAVPGKEAGKRSKEKKVQLQCTLYYGAYKILEELAAEDFCKKCDVVRQLIIDERRRRDRMRMGSGAMTSMRVQEIGGTDEAAARRHLSAESLRHDAPGETAASGAVPSTVKGGKPVLSVTSPVAGENCYTELGIPVEWDRGQITDQSHIQLVLYTPSGESVLDSPQTVPNTGQYAWHPTGCVSGEYYIVLQTRGGTLLGQSEIFNIKKPPYLKR